MLLHCHSRKCNTTRDHKLKVELNDVICMDCGESNNLVNDFMKNAMKTSGDVYRSLDGRKAFTYKCPKCAVDRGVKIVDEQSLCQVCSTPLNLSRPMIEAIKSNVVSSTDDVDDDSKKLSLDKGAIKRRKA